MKSTYRRLVRRRLEAALRIRVESRRPAPVMAPPCEAIPVEVIDLETGPYEARFPDLAHRSQRRKNG